MPKGKRMQKTTQDVTMDTMDESVSDKENWDTVEHIEKHAATQEVMEVDMESDELSAQITRASKFKEATMNSTKSIHPPPNEKWAELGIDHLLEGYDQESNAPASLRPSRKGVSRTPSGSTVPSGSNTDLSTPKGDTSSSTSHEGTLGRLSRAVASFFQAASFSALGKRKAGNESAEPVAPSVDRGDAKERAEAAYAEAMARGLLPTPKVFVRPVARTRTPGDPSAVTPHKLPPTPTSSALMLPRTPTLYKSPSKKDLQKQKKLSKRVSNLESKLLEARKQLAMTLSPDKAPPVPPISSDVLSPPKTNPPPIKLIWHNRNDDNRNDVSDDDVEPASTGKIVKKRKSNGVSDDDYRPVATESDFPLESEHDNTSSKTTPSKLQRKSSSRSISKKNKPVVETLTEDVVIVVPDARVGVPPIPEIPRDMNGKRVTPNRDGYGGFEHEMF